MTMYVALNENNNLVQIENVERGLACKCTCFECGETVIARKGDIKEHHFAHASNKESCNINPESVLHKYAKEVILESMGLMLPAVPNTEDNEAAWWTFDKIIPEFHLGLIRPDLACYYNDEPVFIEIAVTHFIDENKLKIIESMNVNTLEIDLSSLLQAELVIPSEQAKKLILESLDHKSWLYPQAPKVIKNGVEGKISKNPLEATEQLATNTTPNVSSWEDYQFTINGIWVRARKFSSGMLSVNCIYNPEIITILKQWRNEGGGRFDQKYRSWNYWQPFSTTGLERLKQMHPPKDIKHY